MAVWQGCQPEEIVFSCLVGMPICGNDGLAWMPTKGKVFKECFSLEGGKKVKTPKITHPLTRLKLYILSKEEQYGQHKYCLFLDIKAIEPY